MKTYGEAAEAAWEDEAGNKAKYKTGFINAEGNFYLHIYQVPFASGLMQVFQLGKDLPKAFSAEQG